MDRVFLSIGSINIYWYSVLIVTATIIGMYFASIYAEKAKLGKEYMSDLICYLIPISIIGARIYYVIFNFSVFKNDLLSIFKIWEGGLAIYGAVISGIIFIYFYSKKKNKDFLLTLDVIAPYLVLGQAIGRWGNFINKEAHGKMVTLALLEKLKLPKFIIEGMYINGNYYLPTFLFESVFCFIIFLILIIVRKKNKFKDNGLLVSLYFILYGISRFFVEGMRTDSLYIGTFRVSQIVSIILIIIGILSIIIRRKQWKNTK